MISQKNFTLFLHRLASFCVCLVCLFSFAFSVTANAQNTESSKNEYGEKKDAISLPDQRSAYVKAEMLLADGDKAHAAMAFYKLGDYSDARERSFALWNEIARRDTIAAGGVLNLGICSDGSPIATGIDIESRSNLVHVDACTFGIFAGLCDDGTVVPKNERYDYNHWTDIVDVAAGLTHVVGLRADGTVIACDTSSFPSVFGGSELDVSDWTDIIAVSAGRHTVGLRADGTVVAAGLTKERYESMFADKNPTFTYWSECDVTDWTDIIAISAKSYHTVGLKADGTVVAVGSNDYGECDVSDWTDIIAISSGGNHTVGLHSDGTVVAVGKNDDGRCNVSDWTDIVEISAGLAHTLGLRSDGTVVAVGNNDYGQCEVSDWTDIMLPKQNAGLIRNDTPITSTQNNPTPKSTSEHAEIQSPQNAAKEVDKAISSLGTVSLESEEAIRSARSKYDALSNEAKAYVSNLSVLTDAEQTLQKLLDEHAIAEIKRLYSNGDYERTITFAEKYYSGRDLKTVPDEFFDYVVWAYAQRSQQYEYDNQYEKALNLIEKCVSLYSQTAYGNKAQETLDHLNSKIDAHEPYNGQIIRATANSGYCEFTIKNGDDAALVKLEDVFEPDQYYIEVYVREGETATVNVKDGVYRLKYATGERWYSDKELFGSKTAYAKADTTISFATSYEDNHVYYNSQEVTLYKVSGGNMSTSTISKHDF